MRSCRSFDNKENNESIISKTKRSTSNKSTSNSATIPKPTRSSKRARKTDYREFSTSEGSMYEEDDDRGKKSKRSSSRKKPKFSSSENLNFN